MACEHAACPRPAQVGGETWAADKFNATAETLTVSGEDLARGGMLQKLQHIVVAFTVA